MASQDNSATAAAQPMPEENVTVEVTTVASAAMASAAAAAPAATATTTASANDAEASSSQAAVDPAATFPLPSMAAAEVTTDASATIVTNSGAATANIPLTEEEENLAERSRYWLPSGVTEDQLTELVEGGFLPPKTECAWRAPGDEAEPTPQGDERVTLVSHLLRGMTLPLPPSFPAS